MPRRAGLLLVLLPLIAPACSRSEAEPRPRPAAEAPVNVKVEPVKLNDVTDRISLVGETAADAEVTYSAEVPGQVELLGVRLGQRVRAGQVLARIDYTSLKAQADEAKAAHDLARQTFDRFATLQRADVVSKDKLDQARASMVAAEARHRIAQANLAKSVVVAKRSGVVTRKQVERGEYVTPGAPMLDVVDHRTLVVRAQLPESQIAQVRAGTPARVTIDALGRSFDTRVDVVLPVADAASKTYEVRLRLPNPGLRINVGMSTSIQLAAKQRRSVVLVPQDVVVEDGDNLRSVFVEQEGRARRRPVKLGPTVEDQVVVLEGVRAGEHLVVLGQRDLRDGQPVQVVQ